MSKTVYLHLLDGELAEFQDGFGHHPCYVARWDFSRRPIRSVATLDEIKRQRLLAIRDGKAPGGVTDPKRFGYVRVRVD